MIFSLVLYKCCPWFQRAVCIDVLSMSHHALPLHHMQISIKVETAVQYRWSMMACLHSFRPSFAAYPKLSLDLLCKLLFKELHNLMLLEQFKQFLPKVMQKYSNDLEVKTLVETVKATDKFVFIHKDSLRLCCNMLLTSKITCKVARGNLHKA